MEETSKQRALTACSSNAHVYSKCLIDKCVLAPSSLFRLPISIGVHKFPKSFAIVKSMEAQFTHKNCKLDLEYRKANYTF